jgi:hypothetical protein
MVIIKKGTYFPDKAGHHMKIYLFNPENGIYEGEDFTDAALLPGREAIPTHATALAPPSYTKGEVPVYLAAEKTWVIRPVSAVRAGAAPGAQQGGRVTLVPEFGPEQIQEGS